mmetsp:Transcript_23888/g.34198  ORF Transcript_23888/g.34198 Transcript_23888/m.34198 type:complete len:257 (-) Transcript_23888:75-845(-)
MSLINIANVEVLNNPTSFTSPLQFEITFECLQELQDDIEWKVLYVGNAEDNSGDQILEEVMVGPVPTGINRFILQAEAPQAHLIANSDLIGVTVILITCSFMDHKFVQIGYYVNNEYAEPFEPENYPNPVILSKLSRNILAGEPRVTRFAIDWTGGNMPTMTDEDQNEINREAAAFENDDNNVEIDNEADDDEDDEDEDEDEDDENEVDIDEEDDDEGEEDGEDARPASDSENIIAMEIPNEDSNSMDIERMLPHV